MHYMTASPDALRAAYSAHRNTVHTGGRMAQQGPRTARRVAKGVGYSLRQVELIERVADKRRIPLRLVA